MAIQEYTGKQYGNNLLKWWQQTLINKKTAIIIVVSVLSCLMATHYQIKFSKSTILFSLVISFPLLFSIQEAFKRREKALEYLASFKAAMQMTLQTFYFAKKISPSDNAVFRNMMGDISDSFLSHLQRGTPSAEIIYNKFQELFLFMFTHKKEITISINMRMCRYIEDAYNSVAYLSGMKKHGTMVPIRKMAYVFINFFPVIQAPVLFEVFGKSFPAWIIYVISLFSSLLLITFYQIQEQIENPFDQIGLDDISLEDYKLTIKNMPVVKLKGSVKAIAYAAGDDE